MPAPTQLRLGVGSALCEFNALLEELGLPSNALQRLLRAGMRMA